MGPARERRLAMQLTPRTLAMALGACMAGGLVLGVAGMVSPSLAATNAPATAGESNEARVSEGLGDAQVSFPDTSTSPKASVAAPPIDVVHSVEPQAVVSIGPSAEPSSSAPSPTHLSAPAATTAATPRATRSPEADRAKSIPKRPNVGTPFTKTSAPPEPTTKQAVTEVLDGWTAAHLAVGLIDIKPPRLSSKADVNVTVMCSPSTSCVAAGNSLTISQDAQRVTVTWNAPGRGLWRAWSASAAYTESTVG